MSATIRTTVIAALLATAVSAPAFAQHRQNHGPQRPSWHEVQSSHGHKWRKGQKIDRNQRRYVVNDWRNRGLRQPPRGYQWVRVDNNYALVALTSGLIASIIASQ